MKSYHHILVPIDGSDYAKQALQHAIDIAKLTGASITLLNVANMADIINGKYERIDNRRTLRNCSSQQYGLIERIRQPGPDVDSGPIPF